ncbi:FKBP-type peptidyl-prolyl cis-trans isomerase [Nocardioides marmoribigeumensis]|jgi:peptidylprolyl isomerase|uniref:Peptidyl-prolyl cis-trans isomerase n=1 Tax=Nocardioides marmoribigeumensis TaxID=433649 RepID=A0ABU2C155_9ACTN|nr:FKBP-type peptidyl-prolyl cis-trans isomerase [Nocardioides marmoribigeumensis]MDR7364388.1 peptidylprolyl isomerase [Nocardioides marmoribigeumensis]
MRRRLAAGLVAALVLTGTAACGDDSKNKDEAGSITGVSVKGDLGKEPKVTTSKFKVKKLTSAEIIVGDGKTIDKKSVVSARIGIFDSDGKLVQGNYDQNEPQQINMGSDTGPAVQALLGTHAGSRVAVAAPVTDVAGPKGAPQAGLDPDESMLFVFDVLKILPPVATGPSGKKVDPPADAPKVETEGDKVTGLDFSSAPKKQPTQFKVIPLVEGTGPAVKENANITVNYFGTVWGKGSTPFDSSYSRGTPATFQLSKGSLIDGWVKGLVGVKQGSRVMLVIPASLGYGSQGQPPKIPGGATLVFVIDVLSAG